MQQLAPLYPEISAIIDTTRELLQKDAHSKIDFFIVSQGAMQALKGRTIKSKLVKDCIALLNKLAKKTASVEISCIQAHVGHDGNELADEQAKLQEGEQDAPLAKACCKAGIDAYTRDLWNLERERDYEVVKRRVCKNDQMDYWS